MCRIESPALQAVESRDAAARIEHAENRLLNGMERHVQHAIKRRGGDPAKGKFSRIKRENIRLIMKRIAEINREL